MKEILVAPSILSADFSSIEKAVREIEKAQADWVHMDVMDGSFVPQITFGQKMVEDIRKITDLFLDVHLMIDHPETAIDSFAASGADLITVHQEASVHLHRIIAKIQILGKKAGISIVPSTPVSAIVPLLPIVDLVLIMSVNPGFGGQSMIPQTLEKVEELRFWKAKHSYSYFIEVDGGINENTHQEAVVRGAEVLVTGSAFFKAKDKTEFVARLKEDS